MKTRLALSRRYGCSSSLGSGKGIAADWRQALPGWEYAFPRDHQPHREFKTEWWYFTGNLRAADGRRFGYQATFFRQGMRPPGLDDGVTSRFVIDDLKFAHFAVSDLSAQRFHFQQKISRGAFGEAGFGAESLAWIDDWRLQLHADGSFALEARTPETSLRLTLTSTKPWVDSRRERRQPKSGGRGARLALLFRHAPADGWALSVDGGEMFAVTGESWFDHEWATNQLTAEQVGWDWFSIQLDDGTELMLYQMRTRGGGVDPTSSGTFIAPRWCDAASAARGLPAHAARVLDQQGNRRPLPDRLGRGGSRGGFGVAHEHPAARTGAGAPAGCLLGRGDRSGGNARRPRRWLGTDISS